jgi:hypothetical protein
MECGFVQYIHTGEPQGSICLNWNFMLADTQWVKFPMSYTWGEDGKSCSALSQLCRTLGKMKSLPPYLTDAISLDLLLRTFGGENTLRV